LLLTDPVSWGSAQISGKMAKKGNRKRGRGEEGEERRERGGKGRMGGT